MEIISVSRPFPDGQRVTSVAIEYPSRIAAREAAGTTFKVDGRRITAVFTAERPDAETGTETGRYVILALDKNDPDASTLLRMNGVHISAPRPPRPPVDPQGDQGGGL